MIAFTVHGEPVGKGRPRAFRAGKGIRMFTPAKTKSYESSVAEAGLIAMADAKLQPLIGAVSLTLAIWVGIPVSWSKKRKAAALAGDEYPAKKPDVDNVIKAICDGLNGIAWCDDAQVVDVIARKRYSAEPCVHVHISRPELTKGKQHDQ